jgi:hypothetical protein
MGFRGIGMPRHPLFPHLAPVSARRAQGVCSALAGTFAELTEAARAGALARRAVFVLHSSAAPFLSRTERDALWRRFQVPVFAMLLDAAGRLVGYECEVQNGLHLRSALEGAPGVVVSAPCECGRPGNRLILTARIPPASEPAVSAIPIELPGARPASLKRSPAA